LLRDCNLEGCCTFQAFATLSKGFVATSKVGWSSLEEPRHPAAGPCN
jgi:hypothetical protein